MLPIALLFTATLFEEVSETLGKKLVTRRRENVFNMAFLGMFWTVIFLVASTFFGAKFVVHEASLPTLSLRVVVEIFLNFAAAEAIVRADRSTLGFIRLLTIPLLLFFDIALGYHLTPIQIGAVVTLFMGLMVAFHENPAGKRGAGWATLVAILAAISATIYKWDITRYNSVVGEQIIVYSSVLVFFFIRSSQLSGSPLGLLFNPVSGTQSIANGIGLAVESFAYSLAPASVVVAIKRSLAVMWSIVFGHKYFHEKKLRQKLVAGAVLALGLTLIASPYI